MKRILITLSVMFSLMLTSCAEYLDIAPESGITEEEVFTSYANTLKYFNYIYSNTAGNIVTSYPGTLLRSSSKYDYNGCTDFYDSGRLVNSHRIKGGIMSASGQLSTNNSKSGVLYGGFATMRIVNKTLANIDKVLDANEQSDIEEIKGEAYFARAWAHYAIAVFWGGLPYLDAEVDPANSDLPRLSLHDTYVRMAEDFYTSYETFKGIDMIRRDPFPGETNHLNGPKQNRPAGIAALAMRSRVLLYAASPLSNPSNNIEDWAAAAAAADEALRVADEYQFALTPIASYDDNTCGAKYTNEQLWAHWYGQPVWSAGTYDGAMGGPLANDKKFAAGQYPTQNLVDQYGTADGYMLRTPEERAIATAAGSYNEQNPYVNRDPRFYHNVIYNQAALPWNKPYVLGTTVEAKNKANIFYVRNGNTVKYSTLLQTTFVGTTKTGYYGRKRTGNICYGNTAKVHNTNPLFRLAELYLNYAESANEAWGPDGKSPGALYTAKEALNASRTLRGMIEFKPEYLANQATFRETVRSERNIEFDQEGDNRWHDIRRWKIAPEIMKGTLYGMDIEKLSGDYDHAMYPTGFKYERVELAFDRQTTWKEEMWFLSFPIGDEQKMINFDMSLNPQW